MAYRNRLTSARSSYKSAGIRRPAGLQLLASVEFNTKNLQQGIVRPAEILFKIRVTLRAGLHKTDLSAVL